MVNVPKHSWNLHHTTFITFIDHGQVNWVGESQFYWHAEPWDYLLTHCVPMTSISFLIETIERYQLRCKYLKNKKILVRFCLHFWNLTEISNVWKKKMTLIAFLFSKLRTPKTCLDQCLKSLVWEDSSTRHLVNVPKHCWNLHHTTFIIFIDHHQVHWVGKNPSYWHPKSWDC